MTWLAWAGAALYPAALGLAIFSVGGPVTNPRIMIQAVGATLAMSVLTGLLRHRPFPALILMLTGCAAVPALSAGYSAVQFMPFIAVDLAVGFIVATRTARLAGLAVALASAVQMTTIFGFFVGGDVFSIVVIAALGLVTACMAGWLVRERRDHAVTLRTQEVAEAVTSERLRIAREMHDMVAHTLGIVALQAGAARRVIDTQPGRARDALGEVEAASRETLSGLRRMLGALRQADPDKPAPLDEMPGLADIGRLAETATAAGVHVDVRWLGERRPLPKEIDLSAFRIIQESVTNVVRHSGTRSCLVSIDCRDEELAIEVVDDGRGGGAADSGYGLVGMRERVSLLHGDFSAGPRPGGGFRVSARLPVPAGVR